MEPFIKSEPIDYDENNNNFEEFSPFVSETTKPVQTYVESQYQSEQYYINNIENVLLDNSQFDADAYDLMNDIMLSAGKSGLVAKPLPERNINLLDAFVQINNSSNSLFKNNDSDKPANISFNKPKALNSEIQKPKMQEQLAREKKRILLSLIESASNEKKSLVQDYVQHEPLSQDEEDTLLVKLTELINQSGDQDMFSVKQLRAKLELRRLKRKKRVKVFDIDSYVNELIDREKMSAKAIKREKQIYENQNLSQPNQVGNRFKIKSNFI